MTLRFLDVFCRVFEKKSFSRAAEALFLTQPTVSSHIKALEDELEVKLFDRLGREVAPTKAGQLLYGYASEIERLNREAREAITQFSGQLRGRIEVGGSTIPGEYLLPDLIGRFRQTYPDIIASLHIGDTKEITAMVIEGRADIGIIGAPVEDRRLDVADFAVDELILVAAPTFKDAAIVPKELETLPFISRELGSGSRKTVEEAIQKTGLSPDALNVVAEMGSTEAVKSAVKAGMGLSIISTFAVKDELSNGSLREVKLAGTPIRRTLYVISHAVKAKSPICQVFLDFIEKNGPLAQQGG